MVDDPEASLPDDPTAHDEHADGPSARASGLWRLAIGFGLGAVVMAGLAFWLWFGPGEDDEDLPPVTITGVVSVIDEGYAGVTGPGCRSEIGEGEVAGSSAFLVDGEGNQLATAALGEGTKGALFECRFPVEFPDAPAATAYQLTVDGGISSDVVPRSQLEAEGWVLAASIGTLGR
jgi:hypothetical protein